MPNSSDLLASLVSPEMLAHAEQINMPYLGYHLLRETLTRRLLGESEAPILYWMGRDLGKQLPIQSAQGLVLPFIRLGLGKLEVAEERVDLLVFTLTHSAYDHLPEDRLVRTLALECGMIAGAVGRWREREAAAQLTVRRHPGTGRTEAVIAVTT